MYDQTPSSDSEVMTPEELIEKTGFILPDQNALKNIYARILHGLSPSIRHDSDTLNVQPGCNWQFTPDIFLRVLTLDPEKHRPDHFP